MGRKRKKRDPLIVVEAMLAAEAGIRQAVEDMRQEVSFYPGGRIDGGTGVKSAISDRTGNTVLKLNKELKSVFVFDVGTVISPEKWLEVFDAVRERAKKLEKPYLIFDLWRFRYEEGKKYVGEELTGKLDWRLNPDCYILWIIYWTEAEAVKRGLMTEEQCSLYQHENEGALKTEILETCEPRKDIR